MIAIKSNKALTEPTRDLTQSFVKRTINFFQITEKTNEISLQITEDFFNSNDELTRTETFLTDPVVLPIEIVKPIYDLLKQQLKAQTEAKGLFGSQIGDFDIIEE